MFNFGTNTSANSSLNAPQSNSLFGNTGMTNPNTPTSNMTSFQTPLVAQPSIGIPFPRDTNFMDLPPEIRTSLETVEKSLIQASDQSAILASQSFEETERISKGIQMLEQRLIVCEASSENVRTQLSAAKSVLNQFWRYGESVARMVVASRQLTPEGRIQWVPIITPGDLVLLEELSMRLVSQIQQLESSASMLMRQLDLLSSHRVAHPELLSSTLKTQGNVFIKLAAQVNQVQEEVEQMRKEYRSFIAKFRDDLRDPFARRKQNITQDATMPKKDDSSSVPGNTPKPAPSSTAPQAPQYQPSITATPAPPSSFSTFTTPGPNTSQLPTNPFLSSTIRR